jgi:polyhydroxyalkanoate synthesis regulator phasin
MHQRGLAAAAALPDPSAGATPTEVTPTETQGEVATTTEEMADSFTKLDPSTLPAEVRPYYDSMLADYTRKTQEAAPYRKLAEDTGLDVDGLRNSAELYSALQDPTQIVEFHRELTDALVAQGLTPAEAAQAATAHVAETVAGEGEDLSHLDPEERRVQELTARLDRFEQAQRTEQEKRQQVEQLNRQIADWNQQEMAIKSLHPDWTQADIDATYEMAAFYGNDLIKAAARLDEYASGRVTQILNGKGQAANIATAPVTPAGAASRGMDFGDDLNAAHKAALAAAKLLPDA